MTKNFPNLLKEKDTQVQKVQRIPNKMNAKRPTPTPIINKMASVKDKEKILKAAREYLVTYKGALLRQSADFFNRNISGKKGLL